MGYLPWVFIATAFVFGLGAAYLCLSSFLSVLLRMSSGKSNQKHEHPVTRVFRNTLNHGSAQEILSLCELACSLKFAG